MHPIENWVQYQEHLATDHIQDNTDNHIMMISRNNIDFNDEQNNILDYHNYNNTIWITLRLYKNIKSKIRIVENPIDFYTGTQLNEVIKFNITCVVDI